MNFTFIESLYDPYLHYGNKKFVYGEPFSYFSKNAPPGFENTDLNINATSFNPRSPILIVYSKNAPTRYIYAN